MYIIHTEDTARGRGEETEGEEGRGKREEGRGKREEGRGKREEGRGKREEGRGKREEEKKTAFRPPQIPTPCRLHTPCTFQLSSKKGPA